MNGDSVLKYALAIGAVNPKVDGRGWVTVPCPFAATRHEKGIDNHPSFGLEVSPGGRSRARCFSCGSAGFLDELIMDMKHDGVAADYKTLLALVADELDDIDLTFPEEEKGPKGVSPWPETWLQSFAPVGVSAQARNYLQNRKGGPFPEAVWELLDLRWDGAKKRICFPLRSQLGTFCGMHGRTIDPHQELKYLFYPHPEGHASNPHVWHGENTVDFDKPVLVAESVYDYARAVQVYRNTITLRTSMVTWEALNRIDDGFEFVTLFDPDKAGDKARQLFTQWGANKKLIKHIHLPDNYDGADMMAPSLGEFIEPYVDTLDNLLA